MKIHYQTFLSRLYKNINNNDWNKNDCTAIFPNAFQFLPENLQSTRQTFWSDYFKINLYRKISVATWFQKIIKHLTFVESFFCRTKQSLKRVKFNVGPKYAFPHLWAPNKQCHLLKMSGHSKMTCFREDEVKAIFESDIWVFLKTMKFLIVHFHDLIVIVITQGSRTSSRSKLITWINGNYTKF